MHCPACNPPRKLEPTPLESGELRARSCASCRGTFIRSVDYWKWRAQHPENLPELPPGDPPVPLAPDSGGLRCCPDCEYVMARMRIGHGVPFAVDRCRNCEGAWLDGGEWEALKARQLHDDLHLVFDEAWQRAIRFEEQAMRTEESFKRRLGDDIYARIRSVREWLDEHPKRSEIFAYLQLKDRRE